MPSNIGQLKSLQLLTNFIVGQKSGLRIGELGELSDIRGKLGISNMENVACAKDALQANMKDKKHLDELALNWSYKMADGVVQSGVIDHVLNNLQPHPNLKQFTIKNYPGAIFPDWLGDPSFSNLLCLVLWRCENCSSLPALGLLPSLQQLLISRMTGIAKVGSEFYGDASSSITIKPSFPSLQALRFEYMDNWEKWLCCGSRRGEFPRLQELYIKKCPKLTGKLPKQLRCLKKLEIDGCPQLVVASLKVPAISKLTMWKSGKLRLKRPASDSLLFKLQILKFQISLEKGGLSGTLKSLNISGCNKVEFLLPELGHAASLNYLEIEGCPNLVYIELPALDSAYYTISKCLKLKLLAHTLSSLCRLELEDCPELLFRSLPSNLCKLGIENCNTLTPEEDWGLQRMASLTHLTICVDAKTWSHFPRTAYCPPAQFFSILPLFKDYTSPCALVPVPLWSSAPYLPHRTRNLGLPRAPILDTSGLQHLTSLERLSIRGCPKLQYLTKERLPDSLRCLGVNYCPLLEKRCQFEKGQEWCYIAHIPQVEINDVLMWAFLIFSAYFSYAGMGNLGEIEFKRLSTIVVSERVFPPTYSTEGNATNSCPGGLTFLGKFGCREPALSSLEELRISNFPKLQLLDRSALFWNIGDSLQRGNIGVLF
ncbi:putative disease resistance RPP13-like protein 1 [Vitis vinifera]|uniref:Putative disease resistance RPP13-like protein 1 n=1 Tax=Vitis vinifera TaxID=29760 RepID=A0A438G472_VITVI|nr:putative disease resistance RPP13-like protein 1 [Vitis vinifera]